MKETVLRFKLLVYCDVSWVNLCNTYTHSFFLPSALLALPDMRCIITFPEIDLLHLGMTQITPPKLFVPARPQRPTVWNITILAEVVAPKCVPAWGPIRICHHCLHFNAPWLISSWTMTVASISRKAYSSKLFLPIVLSNYMLFHICLSEWENDECYETWTYYSSTDFVWFKSSN